MTPEQYAQLLLDVRIIIREELAMHGTQAAAPAHDEDAGELMTVREVADALSCSVPHARNLINKGDIPFVLFAGRKYVTKTAFKALCI